MPDGVPRSGWRSPRRPARAAGSAPESRPLESYCRPIFLAAPSTCDVTDHPIDRAADHRLANDAPPRTPDFLALFLTVRVAHADRREGRIHFFQRFQVCRRKIRGPGKLCRLHRKSYKEGRSDGSDPAAPPARLNSIPGRMGYNPKGLSRVIEADEFEYDGCAARVRPGPGKQLRRKSFDTGLAVHGRTGCSPHPDSLLRVPSLPSVRIRIVERRQQRQRRGSERTRGPRSSEMSKPSCGPA